MKKVSLPFLPVVLLMLISAFSIRSVASVKFFGLTVYNPEDVYDETFIAFDSRAIDSVDQFDSPKSRDSSDIILYTKIDSGDYYIQVLSQPTIDKIIPLGFDAITPGSHLLRLSYIEELDSSIAIILEDSYYGTFVNLRKTSDYWFDVTPGINISRFRLHINPPLSIISFNGDCEGPSAIQLNQPGNYYWNVEIMDSLDNPVPFTGNITDTLEFIDLATGTYTITFTDSFNYSVTRQVSVTNRERAKALFQVSDSILSVNSMVYFFDYSIEADDHFWDFGDGIQVSGVAFPSHTYSAPGEYTVKLTAGNSECSAIAEKIIHVTDPATGIFQRDENKPTIHMQGSMLLVALTDHEPADIVIFNALGQLITQINDCKGSQAIQINSSEQLLLVKLHSNGRFITRKVIHKF